MLIASVKIPECNGVCLCVCEGGVGGGGGRVGGVSHHPAFVGNCPPTSHTC